MLTLVHKSLLSNKTRLHAKKKKRKEKKLIQTNNNNMRENYQLGKASSLSQFNNDDVCLLISLAVPHCSE